MRMEKPNLSRYNSKQKKKNSRHFKMIGKIDLLTVQSS